MNYAELIPDRKTGRHRSCEVGPHRDVRINTNSEISNDGRWNHEVSADSKRGPRQLVDVFYKLVGVAINQLGWRFEGHRHVADLSKCVFQTYIVEIA